jgi:hypothetical protein
MTLLTSQVTGTSGAFIYGLVAPAARHRHNHRHPPSGPLQRGGRLSLVHRRLPDDVDRNGCHRGRNRDHRVRLSLDRSGRQGDLRPLLERCDLGDAAGGSERPLVGHVRHGPGSG